MAKGSWKDLLPCRECYQVVKNKSRLRSGDKVMINIFTQHKNHKDDGILPYYTFNLTLDSIKRPGGQRYRQIYPLLADHSLGRCEKILEKNSIDFHRNLWLSFQKEKMDNDDSFLSSDVDIENDEEFKEWRREKKREFKDYYTSLNDKKIYHGKSCYVDFYLSDNDEQGLIAKINRRKKLTFFVNPSSGEKQYLDDKNYDTENIQTVKVKTFEVFIYNKDQLALKINGNVSVVKEKENLSLENLLEQGIDISSGRYGVGYA